MSSLIVRRRLRARRNGNGNGNGSRGGGNFVRILLIAFLGLFFLGALGVAAGVGTVFAVYQHYARDYVPIEDKLRQTHIGLTEVYDRGGPEGGQLLGHLSNPDAQLLDPVPLDEISEWMIIATVSTEDNSFWTHQGVNIRGLLRAGYENYVLNEFGEGTGGSSITQQLIKNIYLCPQFTDSADYCDEADRTVDRKLREIAYAIELERDYSKEDILEWYLNHISYASRYVGVQAASDGYFRKDASDLNLPEAALLAGIPSSPAVYHPRLSCALEEGSDTACITDAQGRTLVGGASKSRQEDVLELMVSHGWITPLEAAEAIATDLWIHPHTNPITAPEYIDNWVQPQAVRMCEAGLLELIDGADDCRTSVHSAGYTITTSLDWEATEQARALIQERIALGLERGSNAHNASIVTIEPETGEMMVYVPNIDGSNTTDPRVAGHIDQAVEIRQPGSAFKPLIYLAWMDVLGKTPVSTFWDTNNLPLEGAVIRNPRSDALGSEGLITAQQALGGSQNVASVRAAHEAGLDNVIEYAKRMGITTLSQGFDPTFLDHEAAYYGPSIATGGANIRVVDLAYMNATIANMGEMVGVRHHAPYVELEDLRSFFHDEGAEWQRAQQQYDDFRHGNIRIPGTRELDPVVILEIRDADGNVIFEQGEPERIQVVDAGSVWLLHSIMSDCTVRLIIWGCGTGNTSDTRLDFFADGVQVPSGVKTGTQQGPLSSSDTMSTWTTGYSRYAATALWVGNANNELINDGPAAGYASAHTTIYLYKLWMGQYHEYLQGMGQIGESFAGFGPLQPSNVTQTSVQSPATDRGRSGGCEQMLESWVRTDVSYTSECERVEIDVRNGLLAGADTPAQFRETRGYVRLPGLGTDLARELARRINSSGKRIPVRPTQTSTGGAAVSIASPTNGATLTGATDVIGTVGSNNVLEWTLQFGQGSSPSSWTTLGSGSSGVSSSVLGTIDVGSLESGGVYTIRLTASDALIGSLSAQVQVNISVAPPEEPGEGEEPGNGDGGSGGQPTPGPGQPTPAPAQPTPSPAQPTQPPAATPTPGGGTGGGTGGGSGGGSVSHPTGFQLCGGDPACGGASSIVVRCGPQGWFLDPKLAWNSYGWPRFVVSSASDAPQRAAQVC